MSDEEGIKFILGEEDKPPIKGVGIVFYPPSQTMHTRKAARLLAENIRQGSIICMSSQRDVHGHLLWDFRIEGGDPGQVEVRRSDDITLPIIVEERNA